MHSIRSNEAWSVASAKSKLSELIERAQQSPQVITRHGKPSAVVVSVEEWERKAQRKTSLLEFLQSSPLSDKELNLERIRDTPKAVTF